MLGPNHHDHSVDNFKGKFIQNQEEMHWNSLVKSKDQNSDLNVNTLKDRILFTLHLKVPCTSAWSVIMETSINKTCLVFFHYSQET
jgi:hypothetical protein